MKVANNQFERWILPKPVIINEVSNFYQVCPKEMLNKLDNPISNKKDVGIAS